MYTDQLLNYIDIYERNGSGWVISRIEALDITLWQLDPLRASSYHRLPAWIINKHAVTNVRNTGNDCFKGHSLQECIQLKEILID